MKIRSVRLPDQDPAEIERLSTATGKTPAELARKHGLVGCFDGSKDLSRNARRHLRRRLRARHSR